jgi:hypothetical protein
MFRWFTPTLVGIPLHLRAKTRPAILAIYWRGRCISTRRVHVCLHWHLDMLAINIRHSSFVIRNMCVIIPYHKSTRVPTDTCIRPFLQVKHDYTYQIRVILTLAFTLVLPFVIVFVMPARLVGS